MHKQLIVLLLAVSSLCSCGVDSKHFKLEGRILNINRGEFYVYDNEGLINGIDTVKVEGGRFTYEMRCEKPTTVMLVFPNFSEQPIFAQSGKKVKIQGDASHLKLLEVKGTKDNELMTEFREQTATASPPEIQQHAIRFVEDHPKSVVGLYLVKKYLILGPHPNLKEAARLIALMDAKQPDNARVTHLSNLLKNFGKAEIGTLLPTFTAYDMNGRLVSSADLAGGTAVIATWASWNYDSMEQLRRLKKIRQNSNQRLKVVSISVDASRKDCRQSMRQDSIAWPNICDGMMFEGKTIKTLGMTTVPDNMLIKNGRIVAKSLSAAELEDKIQQNL